MQGLISVVRVEVTNDLSYCTVYVSAMEGLEHAKEAVKGLKSAAGFIRRELGHRLSLRHTRNCCSALRIPLSTARTLTVCSTTWRAEDPRPQPEK